MKQSRAARARSLEKRQLWTEIRNLHLLAHPDCELRLELEAPCWGVRDVHHRRRQARRWGHHEELMTVCRGHHDWLHHTADGQRMGRERGWLLPAGGA